VVEGLGPHSLADGVCGGNKVPASRQTPGEGRFPLGQKQYTLEEETRLAGLLSERREPRCPRCGAAMARQDVSEPEGVSYVRDRIWLICGGCKRSVVLDRRRVEGRR
jgi:hypothetical protein